MLLLLSSVVMYMGEQPWTEWFPSYQIFFGWIIIIKEVPACFRFFQRKRQLLVLRCAVTFNLLTIFLFVCPRSVYCEVLRRWDWGRRWSRSLAGERGASPARRTTSTRTLRANCAFLPRRSVSHTPVWKLQVLQSLLLNFSPSSSSFAAGEAEHH